MEQRHEIISRDGTILIEGTGPVGSEWAKFIAHGQAWRILQTINLRVRRDGKWIRLHRSVAVKASPTGA